ncbi:MAG: exodeoxyribonuclease V subunit alpha [Spirochaetota bacterium]|nr:exodeoxyribonuclease V subunit alpha [Spirochaetota bacterium]
MKLIDKTKTIHHHFANFICSKYHCHDEVLNALLFCVSYMAANGHSCLSLGTIASKSLRNIIYDESIEIDDIVFPDEKSLKQYVLNCDAFAKTEHHIKPLVYRDGNCYLYRYFNYENTILQFFILSQGEINTIYEDCSKAIEELQSKGIHFANEQVLAQLTALKHRFCVVSGGPGTGKTTVIAAIVYQLLRSNPDCSIALCAPTGKAASRLMQAIAHFKETYVANSQMNFPAEAFTIHRLLGYQKGELEFYYNEQNPLPYDVVIVDECSMVDIPLMAKLTKALKSTARLILVGDKDQLSSVEAGAFFGDVCWGTTEFSYTDSGKKLLDYCNCNIDDKKKQSHPLRDAIVILNKTFRFGADSGIAALASAIRNDDEHKAIDVLSNNFADVELKEYDSLEWLYNAIQGYAKTYYSIISYISDQHNISDVFNKLSELCILTPFNRGPWGVETFNALIEKQLRPAISGEWYNGRIIMITANDYNLDVFNGDVGIHKSSDDAVYFVSADGSRKINTSLLTNYVPAYSITVHKSQGSEFNHVVLILPHIDIGNNEHWKMLLTRELLYTAVTRARNKLTIIGNKKILQYMMKNPTIRSSGLRQRLWQ